MADNRCFVIMQFTEQRHLNRFYHEKLEPLLRKLGYICERCDIQPPNKLIEHRIIESIYEASLVVADLTNMRPNVLYELGIAHTVPKKTVLISQDRLPFDLRDCDTIMYKGKEFFPSKSTKASSAANRKWKDFATRLSNAIRAARKKSSENPVTVWRPQRFGALEEFAVRYLTKSYQSQVPRFVLIDLDGTLFDSKTHREKAFPVALKKMLSEARDEHLQDLYKLIYAKHEKAAQIIKSNIRYNWLTPEMYKLAYMCYHNRWEPENDMRYANWLKSLDPKETRRLNSLSTDACEEFQTQPIAHAPDAQYFLAALKKLGFNLCLFTEGDKKTQDWKLNAMGLSKFFPQRTRYVGWAFTPLDEVENAYQELAICKHKNDCGNFCKNVWQLYSSMQTDERAIMFDYFLRDAFEEHEGVKVAFVGDRYDTDLEPFKKIRHMVARVLVTGESEQYEAKSKADLLKELGNGQSNRSCAVENLWQAFEFIATPQLWEKRRPIIRPGRHLPLKTDSAKIRRVAARLPQIAKDRQCPFVEYARRVTTWHEERKGKRKKRMGL